MGLKELKPEAQDDRSSEDSVDCYVALRMRERRIMLGLTQQQLAEMIGAPCPQIHKYETGVTRIATSRLFELSQALGVEVDYFFEGMHGERSPEVSLQQQMLLELTSNFNGMSEKHQIKVNRMARSLVYPAVTLVDNFDDVPQRKAVAS